MDGSSNTSALRPSDIIAALAELDQGVPWAHHFNLGGIDTVSPTGDSKFYRKSVGTKKLVELALGFCRTVSSTHDLRGRRVLDLASGEGAFSIAFARAGAASVTGIEGRKLYVQRAQLVAKVLAVTNVRFIQDDVRSLIDGGVNGADVTLCTGILHHLPPEDFIPFLKAVGECTGDVLFLYTHVATSEAIEEFQLIGPLKIGNGLAGYLKVDHLVGASPYEMKQKVRSSLNTLYSFWATEETLMKALKLAGFSMILKVVEPHGFRRYIDRNTRLILIARKTDPSSR